MSRLITADWSTINIKALRKLPIYVLPDSYHLQDDMGNGCAGDPPGYPTYFTRSVYTRHGNGPRKGPQYVIRDGSTLRGIYYDWSRETNIREDIMRKLWNPLPLEHVRTQAWIRATFAHHQHCYQVPALREAGKNWSDAMLTWPGGCLGKTPSGTLRDLKWEIKWATEHRDYDKWTADHKAAFASEIEMDNARIVTECKKVAIPDNHSGTIIVRQYYPEFTPTPELIAAEYESSGYWWEVMAAKPRPEKCPGQYGHAHPVNTTWCQMCGWRSADG